MIVNLKVYKCMGYLFPIGVASAIVTGLPGALSEALPKVIALVFYWYISSYIKNAYTKKLDNQIAALDKMHDEVTLLIKICNQIK